MHSNTSRLFPLQPESPANKTKGLGLSSPGLPELSQGVLGGGGGGRLGGESGGGQERRIVIQSSLMRCIARC